MDKFNKQFKQLTESSNGKFESCYFDVDNRPANITQLNPEEIAESYIASNVDDFEILVDNEHMHAILHQFYNKLEEACEILNDLGKAELNGIPPEKIYTAEGKHMRDFLKI